MAIIFSILGISLIQFSLYYLNYRSFKNQFLNVLVLIGILVCYYLLLPKLFYPDPKTIQINCGMPILGINFAFWIFGTIAAMATHIIWLFWKFMKNRNKKVQTP